MEFFFLGFDFYCVQTCEVWAEGISIAESQETSDIMERLELSVLATDGCSYKKYKPSCPEHLCQIGWADWLRFISCQIIIILFSLLWAWQQQQLTALRPMWDEGCYGRETMTPMPLRTSFLRLYSSVYTWALPNQRRVTESLLTDTHSNDGSLAIARGLSATGKLYLPLSIHQTCEVHDQSQVSGGIGKMVFNWGRNSCYDIRFWCRQSKHPYLVFGSDKSSFHFPGKAWNLLSYYFRISAGPVDKRLKRVSKRRTNEVVGYRRHCSERRFGW